MNGRTCQFCGKPLSRIWAGSGGDYCSREHRTQHRLRCGMDTLLEANKHASLMRRRDQPRQFLPAQLQLNSAVSPQAFRSVTPAAPRQVLRGLPATCVPANARMVASERFRRPPAPGSLRGRFQAQPRPAARTRRASSRPPAQLIRRSGANPVGLSRAGAAPIRFQRNMGEGSHRSFAMLPRTSLRAILSARAFRGLNVSPVGSLSGKRPRGLKFAAKVGNAFRVSVRAGFRLPAMSQPTAAFPGPKGGGLTWPESLPLAGAACIGQAIGPFATELDFPIAAARWPVDPKVRRAAGLQLASAVPVSDRTPYGNRLDTRSSDWVHPAEGHLMIRNSGLRAGQLSVGPSCIALKPAPAGAAAAHRVVRAPFEPRDQAMINISYSWNASK